MSDKITKVLLRLCFGAFAVLPVRRKHLIEPRYGLLRFSHAIIFEMSPQSKKATLSTEPYKGVRDFYPEDQALLKHFMEVSRKASESFGYEEYGASVLEPAKLYKAKGAENEELVGEQTYTFLDRGEREVTLRPEMTPTVARMVAGKKRELVFPLRWYSIPNVFRYERPQRGRLREHFQYNADIFGVETVDAEVELIALAYEIMRGFGATDDMFVIRLNSRKSLNALLAEYHLSPEKTKELMTLIDRKTKIKNFDEEALKIVGKPFVLSAHSDEEVEAVRARLGKLGITNTVYDPSLARGFDYYTGIVFELFDTDPENPRSLAGGGRYDNLTSLFSNERVPGVGFAMGDVTIGDFLGTHGLLPKTAAPAQLMLCTISPEAISFAEALAQELRHGGLRVLVNVTAKKVGDQIKFADKRGIPSIVAIGEEEMKTNMFTLKDLKSGQESKVSRALIAKHFT